MITFSDLLEDLLEARRISKKDLANIAGVNPSYVSQLTLGKKTAPSEKIVNRLADALNLDDASRAKLLESAGYFPIVYKGAHESLQKGSMRRTDFGEAPNIRNFYGRKNELTNLDYWIKEQKCQMVLLVGIGGIGKTSLAAALTSAVKDQFEYIFWRSLHNAPPLEQLLQQCLQFLFLKPQPLPTRSDELLSLLLHHLQANRCLLVLDNLKSLLEPGQDVGQYREGYEQYGACFNYLVRRSIKAVSCSLVVRSHEKWHL